MNWGWEGTHSNQPGLNGRLSHHLAPLRIPRSRHFTHMKTHTRIVSLSTRNRERERAMRRTRKPDSRLVQRSNDAQLARDLPLGMVPKTPQKIPNHAQGCLPRLKSLPQLILVSSVSRERDGERKGRKRTGRPGRRGSVCESSTEPNAACSPPPGRRRTEGSRKSLNPFLQADRKMKEGVNRLGERLAEGKRTDIHTSTRPSRLPHPQTHCTPSLPVPRRGFGQRRSRRDTLGSCGTSRSTRLRAAHPATSRGVQTSAKRSRWKMRRVSVRQLRTCCTCPLLILSLAKAWGHTSASAETSRKARQKGPLTTPLNVVPKSNATDNPPPATPPAPAELLDWSRGNVLDEVGRTSISPRPRLAPTPTGTGVGRTT